MLTSSCKWGAVTWRCAFVWCLLAAWLAPVQAQTCAIPGWDGPATPAGVINSYHAGAGTAAAGANSLAVASATGQRINTRALRAGDLVLVMQMQDASNPATAGRHEYAHVVAVAGNTLALAAPLANTYVQAVGLGGVRTWQVVWVPQYASATVAGTVQADRWTINTANGQGTGGVVALDVAGSLTLNGILSAAGAGFRGGAGTQGTFVRVGGNYTDADYAFGATAATINGSLKGEGLEGTPFLVFDGTATPANYTLLLGQGYAAGAGGRGARANAGGGGNDGDPAGANGNPGNQLNAGGGGGGNAGAGGRGGNAWNQNGTVAALNQPAGGNTGNAAGGLGGNAQANTATRLPMGGGGGAGSANNATASAVTAWPPADTAIAANGAAGAITSSGAPGGGVVLVRAGSLAGTGTIDASGVRAYNKAPAADTDAAGGGGAGGSLFVTAGSGNGAGLRLLATGGAGGSSNYFNHGPGGGGGGGTIVTNLAGATTSVTGGANGTDGCCGGTIGNGSPKAYNATAGAAGTVVTTGGTATGAQAGAACLPQLAVTKSTLTPTLTSAPGGTAVYVLNVRNTRGAATNLFLVDPGLPPGWGFAGAGTTTYAYSPAPPPAAGSAAAGAELTSAAAPGALPVGNLASANTGTAVTLRANGAAPGVVPTAGATTPTFGSFFLPEGGSITVTFAATVPATATAGSYHNAAGAIFLDPTRTAAATTRMVTPAAQAAAHRAGTDYAATVYASGATAAVAGGSHSGLSAGPTTDDVALRADLSITKTAPATATPGTTFSYVITPRNNGFALGALTFATSQATDLALANVPAATGADPLTVSDTLPPGVTLTASLNGAGWTCGTGAAPQCQRANGVAYPIAAATDFPAITATARVTTTCSAGGTLTNTASVSSAVGESATGNNTATVTTAVTCGSANLQVTKTNGTGSVAAGGTTSYTVTVSNLGPGAADAATVQDTPGAGLSCTSASCTASGGAVCPAPVPVASLASGLQIPTLPANSSATFVITCSVTATGS